MKSLPLGMAHIKVYITKTALGAKFSIICVLKES